MTPRMSYSMVTTLRIDHQPQNIFWKYVQAAQIILKIQNRNQVNSNWKIRHHRWQMISFMRYSMIWNLVKVAAAAAAAAKVQVSWKERRRIDRMNDKMNKLQIYKMQINKMKPAFCWLNLVDLKHKLTTLDMSTNTYIHTISHKVSLNNKHYLLNIKQ